MNHLFTLVARTSRGLLFMGRLPAFVVLLALPFAAMAAEDPAERIRELEKKLLKSVEMIEQLQLRVRALEDATKPALATSVPVSPTADTGRITQLEQSVAQIASNAATAATAPTGIALHGFADVGYGQRSGQSRKGFNLGSLDFYLTPTFGNGFRGLTELIFETGSDGGLATDLERLQVGYDFNDYLTLWAGRFHTPYGYWNNAFHHGAQIQASILRPRFIAFEDNGGTLPAHSVGLWATGKINSGVGKVGYNAYVANAQTIELENGPGSGVLNPNGAGSINGRATVGGSVSIQFAGTLKGLETGAHWLTSTIDDTSAEANRSRVGMFGGYFAYDGHDWEIIGETYHFRNRSAGKSFSSNASFLQVGYDLGSLTVFGRVEKASFDQADPYFGQQDSGRSYSRVSTGLKFDVTPSAALKFELLRHKAREPGQESYNEGHAQFAVRF